MLLFLIIGKLSSDSVTVLGNTQLPPEVHINENNNSHQLSSVLDHTLWRDIKIQAELFTCMCACELVIMWTGCMKLGKLTNPPMVNRAVTPCLSEDQQTHSPPSSSHQLISFYISAWPHSHYKYLNFFNDQTKCYVLITYWLVNIKSENDACF